MKIFTYCNNHENGSTVALYFVNTEAEITDEDIIKIRQDKELYILLGSEILYCARRAQGMIITVNSHFIKLPENATLGDEPIQVIQQDGSCHSISLRDRFYQCTEAVKFMYGCQDCELKGMACLSQALPSSITPKINHASTYAVVIRLKEKEYILGDFKFIAPKLTNKQGNGFSQGLRPPEDHHFENIDYWRGQTIKGALASHEIQKFKKKNCDSCSINKYQCDIVKTCDGKYPAIDTMIVRTLDIWLPRLEAKNNKLTKWQIMSLAVHSGIDGTIRHKKRKIQLGTIKWSKDIGFEMTVWYSRNPSYICWQTCDYASLCKYFSNLPKTEEEYNATLKDYVSSISSKTMSLWFNSINTIIDMKTKGFGRTTNYKQLSNILYFNHVGIYYKSNTGGNRVRCINSYDDLFKFCGNRFPINKDQTVIR